MDKSKIAFAGTLFVAIFSILSVAAYAKSDDEMTCDEVLAEIKTIEAAPDGGPDAIQNQMRLGDLRALVMIKGCGESEKSANG